MRVDHIDFNAEHWASKTEKEFVDDCLASGNYPDGISKENAIAWLKKAYSVIAPKKKEVETPAPSVEKKEPEKKETTTAVEKKK